MITIFIAIARLKLESVRKMIVVEELVFDGDAMTELSVNILITSNLHFYAL
ncbi:hypothetical protein KUL49_18940 [Alteromonas sp. KUL49]|nr:hypothetical protein KUL49_18940 [Alteromonas sp. KUL49]